MLGMTHRYLGPWLKVYSHYDFFSFVPRWKFKGREKYKYKTFRGTCHNRWNGS